MKVESKERTGCASAICAAVSRVRSRLMRLSGVKVLSVRT